MQKVTVVVLLLASLTVIATAQVLAGRFFGQDDLQTNVFQNDVWEQNNSVQLQNSYPAWNTQTSTITDAMAERATGLPTDFPLNDPWFTHNDPSQDSTPGSQVFLTSQQSINDQTPSFIQESGLSTASLLTSQETLTPTETPLVTFSLLLKAGFSQVTLQRDEFQGKLFSLLELQNFLALPVLQQNMLKDGKTIATFYELRNKSMLLAPEIYNRLKENFSALSQIKINETNGYGESSFYVNDPAQPTVAFLVVKKGTSVYALAYKKDYHLLIKKLIQLLP